MYRDKGDYAAALADINQSITLINNDPYRASAYNNRALIWKIDGRIREVRRRFQRRHQARCRRMRNITPIAATPGGCTGNLERALQDQDRAIELYAGGPGVALGLTLRGETLRYMGEYDRALSDFNQAIRFEPDFAPAFTGRGLTFERIRRSRARQVRIPHGAVAQRKFRPRRHFQIGARNRGGAACGAYVGRAAADHPAGADQGDVRDVGADPPRSQHPWWRPPRQRRPPPSRAAAPR